MGVIYKILKQQREQQHQGPTMDLCLSTETKCKVQAAIKQRQQQRRLENHLEPGAGRALETDTDKKELAEQQFQQLCRLLAENATRKKRQSFKLKYELPADREHEHEQEREREREQVQVQLSPSGHVIEMDLIEQLHHAHLPSTAARSTAPRDSILLKIRHQIFERKRQRQLAELVQQRLVVWRPW